MGRRIWICKAEGLEIADEVEKVDFLPFTDGKHFDYNTTSMSFRKRNVIIAQPGSLASASAAVEKTPVPGVRPSPLDGRLTISTGTRSLDSLLAGHAGLALGCSILVEESGTTDFGGALLKYFAAEGVVQGHTLHILGVGESWGRELPGVSSESIKSEEKSSSDEKMKIAWRYERLGEFGAGSRGGLHLPVYYYEIYDIRKLTCFLSR